MTKQEIIKMQAETQPQHNSIASALAAAQMDMGKALKSATNPHFKSKYADLGAVVDACLPALNRHGIAVIQPMTDGETGRCVVTTFIHTSGETLSCPIPLIVGKNDMQGLGSAMTYARRYGLMALAGIAPEDDDGNAAVKAAPTEPVKPKFDAQAEAKRIRGKVAQATGINDLRSRWVSEQDTIARIKDENPEAFAEIDRAKDDRKDALDAAVTPAADLDGDSIPY